MGSGASGGGASVMTRAARRRGVAVTHLMGPGKLDRASLTPGAQALPNGTILYPEPREQGVLPL